MNNLHQEKLALYVNMLKKWSKSINLIGPKELNQLESRHIQDSLQLRKFLPDDNINLFDLGSGGGLPALPLAASGIEKVTCFEAVAKKCSFIRQYAISSNLNITVVNDRIEKANSRPENQKVADVISSRAFAELNMILEMGLPMLKEGGFFLLLKGEKVDAEIKAAERSFNFEYEKHTSETDPTGCILIVRNVKEK